MKNNTVVVLPNPHEPNADRGRNPCLRHEGACNAMQDCSSLCASNPHPQPLHTHTNTQNKRICVCVIGFCCQCDVSVH